MKRLLVIFAAVVDIVVVACVVVRKRTFCTNIEWTLLSKSWREVSVVAAIVAVIGGSGECL